MDMDEGQLQDALTITVTMITDRLSDLELAALNNCAQADLFPHERLFRYEAVADLFTEDGGMRMHDAMKTAPARVALARLGLGGAR